MSAWLKGKWTLPFVLVFTLGTLWILAMYVQNKNQLTEDLYTPAFTSIRVAEVTLFKGAEYPVQVMQGQPIEVGCNYVPPPDEMGTPFFIVERDGQTLFESSKCRIMASFDDQPEEMLDLVLKYLVVKPDGSKVEADSWAFQVKVIQPSTFFRIHGLETAAGESIVGLAVPHEVIPYTEAAVQFKGKSDEVTVIFFVSRLGDARYSVQFAPDPEEPGTVKLVSAPFKRFRSWGNGIDGFAAWPDGHEPAAGRIPTPIKIGNPKDNRQAFEIVAVVVEKSKLDDIRLGAVEVAMLADDTAAHVAVPVSPEYLEEIAVEGLISTPLRVVRTRGESLVEPPAPTL